MTEDYSMKKLLIYSLFVSLLAVSGSAFGQARSWDLDPAHTNFYFTVDHIYSKIRGYFPDFSGKIHFDPADLQGSSITFAIDVKSIDTGIAQRDKHLLSADFFDAANHPKITFDSTSIESVGDGLYHVHGKFGVKGKSYDLTLPLKLEGVKAHPVEKGKDVAGFNGTVTINRLDYGVGTGKFFDYGVVGKDVEILVTVEALSKQ